MTDLKGPTGGGSAEPRLQATSEPEKPEMAMPRRNRIVTALCLLGFSVAAIAIMAVNALVFFAFVKLAILAQ